MANFSTNSEFLAVLSCSPLSPSNLRISIIQQSYGLAIASTELCELVFFHLKDKRYKMMTIRMVTFKNPGFPGHGEQQPVHSS